MNTFFMGNGALGPRQQEFGTYKRVSINGTFRAALLGQNALVLYPQWMALKQMDLGNIIVPILRDNGEPNIGIERRQRTWRDRRFRLTQERYDAWASEDLERLRELAPDM